MIPALARGLAAIALALATGPAAPAPVDESAVADAISHYDRGRFDEARGLFVPAAEAGNATAQYHLGLMLARGEGSPRDLSGAAMWLERAARQRHNHAQFILGHMYARGDGVPRDLPRAHMWFTAAAANGWWKAREARERLVDAGMTPQEVAEAGKLYRAWESGN
ncbi:MAG: tetratricopeptide repeat protein [Betaproteobacteria bacterium]